MLRTINSLKQFTIQATDGELGKVKEAYFDDEQWGVRYLIVETGLWLAKRSVLISPYSIKAVNNAEETINVSLTRDQVKSSPDIDTHKPVSRRSEGEYSRYYGYDNYWMGPSLWGMAGYPVYPIGDRGGVSPPFENIEAVTARAPALPEDEHLRSSDNVDGYHILGTDDEVGRVKDFIFDDEAWVIRYLLADTSKWWSSEKNVLLSTQWISHIDWTDSTVQTTLTREQIKNSPPYDEDTPISRDYETQLHHFYGRDNYWD
ncbi:MAG: PRC-barrel domain-containing protein [Paralcaligenes sp.]